MSAHLITVTYVKLLDSAEFVNQHIHEADFIREAHEHGEAVWVQCDAVGLFRELLTHLQRSAEKKTHHNHTVSRKLSEEISTMDILVAMFDNAVMRKVLM